MKKPSLSRRTFLRGVAYGAPTAVALPVLDCMLNDNGTALAQNGKLPLRLGVWYWGAGVHTNKFFPSSTGSNWGITSQLQPLAEVRQHMNVLSGYDIKSGGIVHHVGTCVMKTGKNYIKNSGRFDTDVAKESFDVTASRELSKGLPFERLDLGVYSDGKFKGEGLNTRALSHNGRNQPNYAETNPQAVFDRLFGMNNQPVVSSQADAEVLARKSVLDSVLEDINALKPRLGASDRMKVEQHFESIRAIEGRLAIPTGMACEQPSRPPVGKPDHSNPDMVRNNELMVDLLGFALACDLTRVFTYRHHGWTDDPVFRQFNARSTHHTLTHNEGGSQPIVDRTIKFTMGQFAHLIKRLAATPEGAGSVLDNCAIMAYSEVAQGSNHGRSNIPLMTAGRAGGALRTGLHHKGSKETATKLNLTMARAVGLNWNSFGEGQDKAGSSISQIEA